MYKSVFYLFLKGHTQGWPLSHTQMWSLIPSWHWNLMLATLHDPVIFNLKMHEMFTDLSYYAWTVTSLFFDILAVSSWMVNVWKLLPLPAAGVHFKFAVLVSRALYRLASNYLDDLCRVHSCLMPPGQT